MELIKDSSYKLYMKIFARDYLLGEVYEHFVSLAEKYAKEDAFSRLDKSKLPSPKEVAMSITVSAKGDVFFFKPVKFPLKDGGAIVFDSGNNAFFVDGDEEEFLGRIKEPYSLKKGVSELIYTLAANAAFKNAQDIFGLVGADLHKSFNNVTEKLAIRATSRIFKNMRGDDIIISVMKSDVGRLKKLLGRLADDVALRVIAILSNREKVEVVLYPFVNSARVNEVTVDLSAREAEVIRELSLAFGLNESVNPVVSRMRKLAGIKPRQLNEADRLSDVDVDEGAMKEILGVPEDKKISDVYSSPKAAVQKLVRAVGEKRAAGMINWAANISGDPFLKDMQNALKAM